MGKGNTYEAYSVEKNFERSTGAWDAFVNTSYAKTTQQNIEDAKNQINSLQQQKEEAQEEVDDISDKKGDIEANLNGLNGELQNIASSMNKLEGEIETKETEIARAQDELAAAELRSKEQYEDMKVRIRFIYENSTASAWQTLLEASSMKDFLNRTEYISQINTYDRQKLDEFQLVQQEIAEQKAGLEADMETLVAMQDEMKQNQKRVNSLISTAQANLAQTNEELAQAQGDVNELEKKLADMIAYEQKLEEQKAREDAARLEAIKQQEQEDTSGVVYVPTDSDAYLLGAIIQCESEGEPYAGKLAVGSVVLNRVKSSYFPNTISGVIYQSGQFSPVASGRLAYRLQAGVNNECLQAAQEVLNGNITLSCLYFRRNNGIIQGTVIGNHVFY